MLYEFGQKSYVIERDGKMVADSEYPGITKDQNLVQGRQFQKDKRLPVYGEDRSFTAPDEFTMQ